MEISKILNENFRKARNIVNISKLKNKDFSIFSSNCNGSFICHDLEQRFNSPFVNLWIYPKDYLKFLKNPNFYLLSDNLTEVKGSELPYPVGKLEDITLYFEHYKSFDEAAKKWNDRKERINWDNLFVIMTERDGCTYEDIKTFDGLDYKNKVIFTKEHYPEIKSAFKIKGFENEKELGICSDFTGLFGKRYLDQFNYVKWLNKGK